jgi:hypothetical protein
MIAAELIQEARTAGVTLAPLPNGRLQATGRPQVPIALKAALQAHKAEVVALLIESEPLADLYRQFWSTPETEPLATFTAIHREIDRLERQAGIDEAWAILKNEARAWHQRTGVCPFCRKRGELHFEGKKA